MDYLLYFDRHRHLLLNEHFHRHFLYYCPGWQFNYLLEDEFNRHLFNHRPFNQDLNGDLFDDSPSRHLH
jgi:hypothetical protein